jgi:hypothetical protein
VGDIKRGNYQSAIRSPIADTALTPRIRPQRDRVS